MRQHNYVAEEHIVTSDGYILKLHRISGGPGNPPAAGKPVAYMQHGMLQSSDSFVTIGPDTDLGIRSYQVLATLTYITLFVLLRAARDWQFIIILLN